MAYVAMGSTHVTGAVAGENIVEGRAVVMSASGLHLDLPTALLAGAGARNVFVAILPPDQFPRPTPQNMFRRNTYVTQGSYGLPNAATGFDPRNSAEFTTDSGQNGPYYNIGPSMFQEPTALSGFALQLHKGGAYTLTANAYTDSSNIRNAGATVAVGTGGKFEYSVTAAAIVGYVREYRDGRLTIVLDQRSA